MKVAIATKARSDKQPALKMFCSFGAEVVLFVEPQDYEAYKKNFPDVEIVNIGENDKGLGFVRNFILDRYNEPFWMIDDDVSEINKRVGNKLVRLKDPSELKVAFEEMEKILIDKKLSQLGLSFVPSNHFFTGDIKYFSRVWAIKFLDAVLIKKRGIGFVLYPNDLFEDYALTLDLILNGLMSATTYKYAFGCISKMGKNEGGCQTYRTPERSLNASKFLVNKFGKKFVGIRYNKEHGQYEAEIKWSVLKKEVLK